MNSLLKFIILRPGKCLSGTLLFLFLISFLEVPLIYAEEYQCNITATNATGCEEYSTIQYTCSFPEELNIERTKQAKTGTYTYPEFCSVTCAEQSGIPKKCRTGRISISQQTPSNTLQDVTKDNISTEVTLEKSTIIENAYSGAKLTFSRFWNWLKKISSGEEFKIEPMSTPVAGVRG